MTTKTLSPSLTDVVPERDARAVRGYASRLESLGHSDRTIGSMISTARHVAVWLAASGLGLETFDIRLVDRFMRHVCHCPGRHRIGKRPGQDQRYFAIRFLRHLLETGHAKAPPEIEAGGHLAVQWRGVPGNAGIRAFGDHSEREPVPSLLRLAPPVGHLPWRQPTSAFGAAFSPTTAPAFIPGSSTGLSGSPVQTNPHRCSGFLPRSWRTGMSSRRRRSRNATRSVGSIWMRSCTGFDSTAASGTRPSNSTNGALARFSQPSATSRERMTSPWSGTRSWVASKPPLADRSDARRLRSGCTCVSSGPTASAGRNSSTRSRRCRGSRAGPCPGTSVRTTSSA